MPNLMMNQVSIHNFIDTNNLYTEEELFDKICRMYIETPIKDISSLWFDTHYTFMNDLKKEVEDAYNEDRNNREELEHYY